MIKEEQQSLLSSDNVNMSEDQADERSMDSFDISDKTENDQSTSFNINDYCVGKL